MTIARTVLLALILVGLSARADEVEELLHSEMETQHIPGLAVALVKDGKILKRQSYGLANVEYGVPVTPKTVFKLASVSKQMLTVSIMLLARDGRLSIDDRINKYLEAAPSSWGPVTIRQLMNHTSGLPREPPGFNQFKYQTDAEVLKSAYSLPLASLPGEKWEYSNTGYFALAEIVTKVSGQPWTDFVRARVFTQLNMSDTRPAEFSAVVANTATGYRYADGQLQHAPPQLALRPSGAFMSTLDDMLKWDAALGEATILPADTLTLMWTPTRLNGGNTVDYGFGFGLNKVNGHAQIFHSGAFPGFRAHYVRFPAARLSIIVLANADTANVDVIALKLAALHIDGLLPKRARAQLSASTLDAYVGKYSWTPGMALAVTRNGDQLKLQIPIGGQVFTLVPQSELVFFSPEHPTAEFIFAKDANGRIMRVDIPLGGYKAQRIE